MTPGIAKASHEYQDIIGIKWQYETCWAILTRANQFMGSLF